MNNAVVPAVVNVAILHCYPSRLDNLGRDAGFDCPNTLGLDLDLPSQSSSLVATGAELFYSGCDA